MSRSAPALGPPLTFCGPESLAWNYFSTNPQISLDEDADQGYMLQPIEVPDVTSSSTFRGRVEGLAMGVDGGWVECPRCHRVFTHSLGDCAYCGFDLRVIHEASMASPTVDVQRSLATFDGPVSFGATFREADFVGWGDDSEGGET